MINYVSLHICQKALSYKPELILQPSSYYYECDPFAQLCWRPRMSCKKTSIVYSLEALHISFFISSAFFYLISMLIPCSLTPLPLFTLFFIWILNSARILCIQGTDGLCLMLSGQGILYFRGGILALVSETHPPNLTLTRIIERKQNTETLPG